MLLPDWVTLNTRPLASATLPLPVTVAALRVTLPVVVLVVVMLPLRVMLPPVSATLPVELIAVDRLMLAVLVDLPMFTDPMLDPNVGPTVMGEEKVLPTDSKVNDADVLMFALAFNALSTSVRKMMDELLLTTSTPLAPRNVRLVVAPPAINIPVCTPVKLAAF